VPEVPGDQLEVVVNGGGGNLEISVRQRPARPFELRLQRAIDPRDLDVVGEHGDRGQHARLDVPKVALSIR
jgi:hypothetical protein